MALHEVGSNNPDGVEIKKHIGPEDRPPARRHSVPPYYTVKDTLGVMVFLDRCSASIMFFMPEFGGYFLEYNNFIPADPLKTPAHIAPVWYFTPYYSILRAITEDFMMRARGSRVVGVRGAHLAKPVPRHRRKFARGRRGHRWSCSAGFFVHRRQGVGRRADGRSRR